MQYELTRIRQCDGSQHLQCMICNAKLNNSSLALVKLRTLPKAAWRWGNTRTQQLLEDSK